MMTNISPERFVLFSLLGSLLFVLLACQTPDTTTPISTETSQAPGRSTLIDCQKMTMPPESVSLLPDFTPAYACELETVSVSQDFCMVNASPELSYPCRQHESVTESLLAESPESRLIQRDYRYSRGCWRAVSTNLRSLRLCQPDSGESQIISENLMGEPLASRDGTAFAFVATETQMSLIPQIFRVDADGTKLTRLDTQPFPQTQVVGAQLIQWSETGRWLDISLWDGREAGYHRYRLRTDGSGDFEVIQAAP